MEEAIWNLEDKWKISTTGTVALLVCTCSLVIVGICTIAAVRKTRRKRSLEDQEPRIDDSTNKDWSEPRVALGSMKEVLTTSVRWSQKQKLSPLLVSGDQFEADFGWQLRQSSDSPVWQRPILMGEKCELPTFSGLILYNEIGQATSSRG